MPSGYDRDRPSIPVPLEYQPPGRSHRRWVPLALYLTAWFGVLVGLSGALLGAAILYDNTGFITVFGFDIDTVLRKSLWTAGSIVLLSVSLWAVYFARPRR
jgi:hypothetical protein